VFSLAPELKKKIFPGTIKQDIRSELLNALKSVALEQFAAPRSAPVASQVHSCSPSLLSTPERWGYCPFANRKQINSHVSQTLELKNVSNQVSASPPSIPHRLQSRNGFFISSLFAATSSTFSLLLQLHQIAFSLFLLCHDDCMECSFVLYIFSCFSAGMHLHIIFVL
jgi:hypothetical protein